MTKEHRNLLTRVPKSAQAMVATLVRTIFAQPDAASMREQHARVVDQLTDKFPAAAELLADAAADVLAFTGFPKEHWRQIWSHHEWAAVRRYMNPESLTKARLHLIDGEAQEVTKHALAEVS